MHQQWDHLGILEGRVRGLQAHRTECVSVYSKSEMHNYSAWEECENAKEKWELWNQILILFKS